MFLNGKFKSNILIYNRMSRKNLIISILQGNKKDPNVYNLRVFSFVTRHSLMLHNHRKHLRLSAQAIINMQVINAVGQTGHVKLHRTAFGELFSQQDVLSVVEPYVENRVGVEALAAVLLKGFHFVDHCLINLYVEYVVNRVGINFGSGA